MFVYVCARCLLFKYTLPDVVKSRPITLLQYGNVASLVVCQNRVNVVLALLPTVTNWFKFTGAVFA